MENMELVYNERKGIYNFFAQTKEKLSGSLLASLKSG